MLLVGNAEALTRELFKTLFRLNIRKIKLSKDLNLPLSGVLNTNNDRELSELVLRVLEDDKNPAEKLNFQNMKQLQGIMAGYFGMEIKDDYITDLHEFWQIRHIIIHNSAIADKRFIDNLKKANIKTDKYKASKKVVVAKADYEKCFGLLVLLFDNLDIEIERLKLEYRVDR